MQDYSTTKGKYLTQAERIQIKRWHNRDQLSNREIAYRFNKAPQTIHNELRRGFVQLKYKTKYSAHLAQKSYEDTKKRCGSHRKITGHLNQLALRTLYNWAT